ncbi:hypothetical protein [Chryseobacterium sp. JAH]|uniref:hypothetical protein n=1 Tax=Chryseobacterium sp. JAH TaxID=1742858 RepID=UPI0006465B63|nr:hypothetical protein [Chryseobacterium sp. JAH]KUJ50530.1 hypothetical protein AR685_14645 [Chryseobacterium sp. JAH]
MKSYIRIDKPCSESPEKMQNIPDGKFCNLCSKKVTDFSNMTYHEISNILTESTEDKICGLFIKENLGKTIDFEISAHLQKLRNSSFTKVVAGFALTASFIHTYPSQKIQNVKPDAFHAINFKKTPANSESSTDNGNFLLSGQVISSDKKQAVVTDRSFITATKVYKTTSDENGFYELEIPKDILKAESLLEFTPHNYVYDRKLVIFPIEKLGKKQLIKVEYNRLDSMMGEVYFGPPMATEKSFVIIDGKKLDGKTFNKSYSMFPSRYDVHYIPGEFVNFFTTKESITDIYIVFIKPK